MKKATLIYLDWRKGEGEGFLRDAFAIMRRDNTVKRVFYDGTVKNADEFVADLCRVGSLPFMVVDDFTPVGVAWLNTIEGKTARGHFVFFREAWGHGNSTRLGKLIYEDFLGFKDASGFLFDAILGWTPKSNVLAWKGAIASGAKLIGEIPHGACLYYAGKTENAVLTVATRESLEAI